MRRARDLGARRPGQAGFALVAVIWGLGLATLLGSAVMVGSRFRARDIDTLADEAQAAVAAESAVVFGIRKAMDGDPAYLGRRPASCTLPDGARATLLITPESGKVDLEAAPPALLARLFVALTGEPRRGAALAEAVATFRESGGPQAADRSGPKAGAAEGRKPPRFTTVLELDQVPGVSTDVLTRALPFVTVRSGKPEIDTRTAAPALLALLGLPPDPASATAPIASGDITIHAEVRVPAGAWAVRDALVTIGGEAPFTIREWRIGQRGGVPEPAGATLACLP